MMTETVPSYAQLIRSGEIFSSILPFQFRKYADAEKYLLKAEQKKPQISKIHHKLGSLYCVSDEVGHVVSKLLFKLNLLILHFYSYVTRIRPLSTLRKHWKLRKEISLPVLTLLIATYVPQMSIRLKLKTWLPLASRPPGPEHYPTRINSS